LIIIIKSIKEMSGLLERFGWSDRDRRLKNGDRQCRT